jgi:hypothetical protein
MSNELENTTKEAAIADFRAYPVIRLVKEIIQHY